jgi:serine/threonine protein kinase
MTQLLDAVETVHNANMLHRDIKPENVLIANDNKVVLIDFGSARDYEEAKTLTHSTILTPGYAPIEQYSNRAKRGAFTDIYALGATLYFLLTGQKPLPATDRYQEQLPSPQQLNPAISTQLSSAVMMAMAMKPEDRFQTVADLRAALLLSGKKVEKPVVTEILPVTELPKPEKTLVVKSPAVEEKPVKISKVLIFAVLGFFALILFTFLVFGRGGTKEQTYCGCYDDLSKKVKPTNNDSINLQIYNSGKVACDSIVKKGQKAPDCKVQAELAKKIEPIRAKGAGRLRSDSNENGQNEEQDKCLKNVTYKVKSKENYDNILKIIQTDSCKKQNVIECINQPEDKNKIKDGDELKFKCSSCK